MKQRWVQIILGITFSLVFFSSCALTVLFPGSLNQRPDVSGKTLGGDVSLGLENFVEVTVFEDITSNPPLRVPASGGGSSPTLKTVLPYLPVVNYNLGILSMMDIYYTGHYGVKAQFLGHRNKEGWKASVFGGYGTNSSSISKVTCTGGDCSGDVKLNGFEYGLSIGHGFNSSSVAYLTAGQQKGDAQSKITQPNQIFEYNDKYDHSVISLGFEFGENLYFNPEICYTTNSWVTDTTTFKKTATTGIVALGYKW